MNAVKRTIAVRCPVCRKPVRRDSPHFPFCGERCQQIDLGRWAGEEYRIAGEPAAPWELESGEDE